jgi:hypothetical protein
MSRAFARDTAEGGFVGDRQPLQSKGKEVSDHRTILLVPSPLRNATFLSDDIKNLTPQGISWDGWDVPKF